MARLRIGIAVAALVAIGLVVYASKVSTHTAESPAECDSAARFDDAGLGKGPVSSARVAAGFQRLPWLEGVTLMQPEATDEVRETFGGHTACFAASAGSKFKATEDPAITATSFQSAMKSQGWVELKTGTNLRNYRRGLRERAGIDWQRESATGPWRGSISYSITPYACNGNLSCGRPVMVLGALALASSERTP